MMKSPSSSLKEQRSTAGSDLSESRVASPARFCTRSLARSTSVIAATIPTSCSAPSTSFDGSVVEIRPEASLRKARWEKLGWNVPFNGLCVIAGGVPVDQVIHDPALQHTAHEIMKEVVAAGNADLEARGESARIDGDQLCHLYLTLTAGMGAYRPSTVIDYNEHRPLEIEAIFQQPVERATELGVDCPMMSMLASVVGKLSA